MAGKRPSKESPADTATPSPPAVPRTSDGASTQAEPRGTGTTPQSATSDAAAAAGGNGTAKTKGNTRDAKPAQPPLLTRFIDVVVATAEAKGWSTELANHDERSQQYASVTVWRDSVLGTIELSIEHDGTVRFPIHPDDTFNTTGLNDLARSIQSAVRAQPWIQRRLPRNPSNPHSTCFLKC